MEEQKSVGIDRILVFAILMLLGIGITMIYSASSIYAAKKYANQYYFLQNQLVCILGGLALMFITAKLNFNIYRKLAYPMLILVIISLGLIFVPGIGMRANGAQRWIRIGMLRLQPAEFAKIAIIFYLAHSLTKKSENIKSFSIGFLPHIIITGIVLAMVVIQPDLGSVVIIGAILFTLLFTAGVNKLYLFASLLAASPVIYYLIINFDYGVKRILTFLNPWQDPTGAGFQIIQSFLALGSGGLFGLGLGDGKQKLFYLPAPHTDFILSVIGEELGFIGVSFILFLFFIVVYRGFKISLEAENMFGCLLALGLTLLIGMQAVINAGVVMGLLPTKGLVLPFISYGRSAVIVSLFAMGVLLNISSRKKSW